jgi:hypothetical protein
MNHYAWYRSSQMLYNTILHKNHRAKAYWLHALDSLGHGPGQPVRFAAHRQPLCWNFLYHSRIVLSIGGSMWYLAQNHRYNCLSFGKFQDTEHFLIVCPRHVSSRRQDRHDCPLAAKATSTPWCLLPKQTGRDSLPIDMFLSAVSALVAVLLSLEVPEGSMNYPVLLTGI